MKNNSSIVNNNSPIVTPQSSVIYRYQLNPNNKKRSIDNTENIENLVYHADDKPCPFCRKLCENDHGVKVHITHEHCCKICTKYKWECNGNHNEEEIQKHNISIKRKYRMRNPYGANINKVVKCGYCTIDNFFPDKKALKCHVSHQHLCKSCCKLLSDCACSTSADCMITN